MTSRNEQFKTILSRFSETKVLVLGEDVAGIVVGIVGTAPIEKKMLENILPGEQ